MSSAALTSSSQPFTSDRNTALIQVTQLSLDQLEKLRTFYASNLEMSSLSRHMALMLAAYSFGVAFLLGTISHAIPEERKDTKHCFKVLTGFSTTACMLSLFVAFVQHMYVVDYRFWQDACITFIKN